MSCKYGRILSHISGRVYALYDWDNKVDCRSGVEWGSISSWGCNAGLEVTGESYYDSINLHPLEVSASLGHARVGCFSLTNLLCRKGAREGQQSEMTLVFKIALEA